MIKLLPSFFKIISLPLIFLFFGAFPSYAQDIPLSGTVAQNLQVVEAVEAGDIVVLTSEGVKKSTSAMDDKIIGVVVEFPVISVGQKGENTASILSSGRAQVKVTNSAGAIGQGDLITSSSTAGIGQKATESGFVIGRALSDYDSADIGKISVMINITSVGTVPNLGGLLGRLLSTFLAGLSNAENFPQVLRYIAATIIGVATFILASISFVRFMRTGLDALGRNPLARSTIVAGMVLNAGMIFVLTLAGFGIAVAIIAL